MNVLSLFDGVACGKTALERAGLKIGGYYASEIDEHAMAVAKKNHPDIIHVGDVAGLTSESLPEIDLLIGGSPCQGFSFSGKQLNFSDPRSALFFEYARLLEQAKPRYFLLENVRMKKECRDVISTLLGVEPLEINSSLVSAQSRKRLYWTNIPGAAQPEDRGLVLKDIMETEGPFKGGKLRELFERHRERPSFSKDGMCHIGNADLKGNECIKRVYSTEGKGPTLTTMGGGHREPKLLDSMEDMTWRKLTPLECERMQTMPDFYTKTGVNPKTGGDMAMSNSARYKMIGNGWTVDVLAHLFKNLKDTCAQP